MNTTLEAPQPHIINQHRPVPVHGGSQQAPSPSHILQIGLGFWASKTVLSATELGLFTELARGPLDAETIRQRLGLHRRSIHDFLDALVALRFLERKDGKYSNTADTDLFLDRNKPTYVGGLLEMCNVRLYRDWDTLTERLRTGQPTHQPEDGENPFDTLYSTPEKLESFLGAMTGISLGAAKAISEKFPWGDYNTFADIGAAQGGTPVFIAKAHHHLQGIGYDLKQVQPVFEKYAREHGVADRVKFQTGDFFKDALPEVDVIIMGHILHDWDMEQKRVLIKKAYDALPEGGAFIIYEALIDDNRRENAMGLLMSLNMLVETPGGFDYTGADCQKWLREAGFRETCVEHLIGPDSMVIGIK